MILLKFIIINEQRQVVFANYAFTKMIGKKRFEDGLGQRLGELVDCIHAHDYIYCCGTGENCRYCGAVLKVLKAQETGAGLGSRTRKKRNNFELGVITLDEIVISEVESLLWDIWNGKECQNCYQKEKGYCKRIE